jgi:uncharacterized membrane protein
VLDLRPAAIALIPSEGELGWALLAIAPRLVAFLMRFMTLDVFWVGRHVIARASCR